MPLVHDDLAFSFLQNFFDTYDSDFAKKINMYASAEIWSSVMRESEARRCLHAKYIFTTQVDFGESLIYTKAEFRYISARPKMNLSFV